MNIETHMENKARSLQNETSEMHDRCLMPKLKQLLVDLAEKKDNAETKKEAAKRIYKTIKEEFEARNVKIVPFHEFWPRIRGRGFLLRKDDPLKSLELALGHSAINFKNKEGRANAADDTDEGLAISLTEGIKGREINTVYGFIPDDVDVRRVKKSESDLRDDKRFVHIRCVNGKLTPDSVKYLLIRMPVSFFPEDELSEKEEELIESHKPMKYIIRALDMSGAFSSQHSR